VPADTRPVLYVVACGAYPAGQLPMFVRDAQVQGWDVCVIATPDGAKFLDAGNIAGLTGHPVRTRYKRPDEPDMLPSPAALVVAPATFNTVNKWAQGISDTLALGLLNEAVGLGLPMIAVPWPNAALAAHPVFARSVETLRAWGVTLLLDPSRLPPAPAQRLAGPADSPAQTAQLAGLQQPGATFPWDELRALLPSLRPQPAEPQNS
jgi:phosphopantothenoylcysteine synthetase/decarboxylase